MPTSGRKPNDSEYPQWLPDVALTVDALIRPEGNRRRFREELRRWAANWLGSKDRLARRGVRLLPAHALTMAEKFAVLAAIHDEACEGRRIDLWRIDRRTHNVERLKAAMHYAALCAGVRDLTEQDRKRVKRILRDVRRLFVGRIETPLRTVERVNVPSTPHAAAEPARVGNDWHSAEWFGAKHGIPSSRLSEKHRDGKVRAMNAPKGFVDVEGKKPRLLYHKADALRHCSPKHVTQ